MRKHIIKHVAILLVCTMLFGLSACINTNNSADETKPVQATVVEIEKYGHAVLDITTAEFSAKGYALGDVINVKFGSYNAKMPFYDGYYTNPGNVMLRGQAPEKNIAICINYGDFCAQTGLAIGDIVEISMAKKAGMLSYQELCSLTYSNNRADFADDATFANFRAVTVGNIGDGKLYRSASPINNKHNRASYANAFIESVGVVTVLNLADSDEDIAEYMSKDDFVSNYYATLYSNGKVLPLDLSGNFFTDDFATGIVQGLRFLAQNEPPYSIHCTEGKDRAGFTAMVLEAIMGAELQEIIDDYMLSYYNYYGVDKNSQPERYDAVLNNNLLPVLYHITGTTSVAELSQIDLQVSITNFLLNHGMPENELITLKNKLD